jgi:hypothetical protein
MMSASFPMIKALSLVLLFPLAHATAQDLANLPPETAVLIQAGRSLEPEFSADILLRLSGSRVVMDPAWKRLLVEEAFKAGGRAQVPYRKAGEGSTDTRASRAYWDNGLEALTLQARAVEAMLELDPQRARAMFEEIQTPQVPMMTCQEVGEPNLAGYYVTAGRVFERGFTPEQRGRLEHMEWNTRFLEALRMLEGWKESEEGSSDDWFAMVSEAYGELAELAPPGRQRDTAMVRYLNFMETHYASATNHNLWFTQLHNRWRAKDPWIIEQFSKSANPVISTYATVNRQVAASQ